MDDLDLRDQFRLATADEPPMALDVDSVVAGGERRQRRRRLLGTAGGGTVAALAVAVPVAVVGSGPGPAGLPAGNGGQVTSSPNHGECTTQTHSGSTRATAFAGWLLPNLLPQYDAADPSAASYENDCADGAKVDTVEVSTRVSGTDGDINVILLRANPAEPVVTPCHRPPNPTATPTPARPGALHFTYCQTIPHADGSTVTIEEQAASDGDLPFVSRTVVWWRPDGTQVWVSLDNRHVLDTSHPNPNQVLTRDQTIELATNQGLLVYLPPRR